MLLMFMHADDSHESEGVDDDVDDDVDVGVYSTCPMRT